jgi:hypothetical protein
MNPRLFSLQPGADSIKKLGALLVFGACGLFCPLSGSAAAPSQPDALTAASFSSDFPAEHMPLKVGVVKYVRPSPYEPIVEATIGALKRVFGTSNVIVTHYDLAGLSQAIREGEVDLFLSSSGFYVRMERYGARAAATVASNNYPNPNHNDGSTIVVSAARKSLNKLSDLKGAKLVLSSPQAFTGRQLAEHVLLKAGLNPETLFSSRVYLGDGKRLEGAIPMILSGEADVGFFRLCYLEEWLASHPNARDSLKCLIVWIPRSGPSPACVPRRFIRHGRSQQHRPQIRGYHVWCCARSLKCRPRLSGAFIGAPRRTIQAWIRFFMICALVPMPICGTGLSVG